MKISQSSQKMYYNNIVNFQESTTILNTSTKKSGNLLNAPRIKIGHHQVEMKDKLRKEEFLEIQLYSRNLTKGINTFKKSWKRYC